MLLLDTHAILWTDAGAPIDNTAAKAIDVALQTGGVFVSPISGWEIGMLASKGRINLDCSAGDWFRRFLRQKGVRLVPLTPEAAVGASFLPEPFHPDPADRMLVATARDLDVPLVTRDRRILDYAATGAVRVIAC